MRLDLDTEVRFPTGERAGTLRKVIVDENDDVNEVVISTGDLISRDVHVPIQMLSEGPGDVMYLNCTPDELNDLPDYTEEQVPVVADGWELNENGSAMGEVFPVSTYEPIMPIMEVPNIPQGSVSLDQGTEVWCQDDPWGIVDEVVVDDNGHAQAFIGRPDDINEHLRLIPIQLAQEIDATRVVLNCGIGELATYTEEVTDDTGEPEES